MDSDKWMMVTMGPQTVKWHLSFDTLLGVFYTPSMRGGGLKTLKWESADTWPLIIFSVLHRPDIRSLGELW